MRAEPQPYLLLVDMNAPWVRSLFCVLPGVLAGWQVLRAWRVHSLSYWLRAVGGRGGATSEAAASNVELRAVVLPGWHAARRLSTAFLVRIIKHTIRRFGKPDAVVYTLPQYAAVAERFSGLSQVYYAYDPYPFYSGWNSGEIVALEKRMLDACSLSFGVSRLLVEDLQRLSRTPVYYSPNAVSSSFLEAMAGTAASLPDDLSHIRGKLVGCVGQLHPDAYDWELIRTLANNFPQATFAFIGNKMTTRAEQATEMERTFQLPNVRWLGPKPHNHLPRYLKRFDICLNPLAVNAHSHRRSPLRLYDYLATDKPILSTAIREAEEHEGTVTVAKDASECVTILRGMLDGSCSAAGEARRRYIQRNTWEQRACALWEQVAALRKT